LAVGVPSEMKLATKAYWSTSIPADVCFSSVHGMRLKFPHTNPELQLCSSRRKAQSKAAAGTSKQKLLRIASDTTAVAVATDLCNYSL